VASQASVVLTQQYDNIETEEKVIMEAFLGEIMHLNSWEIR